MLKKYFKIPFRNLFHQPVYSIINILGLSVGLGCFIIIMLWVKYELSYDRFHENSDRLYRVAFTNETKEYHGYWQAGKLAGYLKENFPEIIHSTNFNETQWKVAYEKKGFFCIGSFVDTLFFEMFTFPFLHGNPETSLKQPNSIIITKSLSLKLFGDGNSIDKPVKLNDGSIFTVTGVIEDVPENSHIKFDFLLPYINAIDWMDNWDSKRTNTYVMLQDKNMFEEVNKKISGVMNLFQPAWGNVLYLIPVTRSHLYSLRGRSLITYVLIFSAMAFIIVLLACVNFMNLSTSRSELRQKEIFIKKINGSKRWQIAGQFLAESILSAFIAFIIAMILVELILPSVNNLLHTSLDINYNVPVTVSLLLITLITGLIAGSYPAIYLSSIMPNRIIKGRVQTSTNRKWKLRNILVVLQFTISVFFIICMLLIISQLKYIKSKDLGYNQKNVVKISSLGKLNAKAKELKAELLKNPNIENIAVSSNELTSWGNSGPIEWEGRNQDELIEIGYNWVDYDFLKTFDFKMREGRFFSEDYITDISNAFILNEKAVSYLHLENPVGMKVKSWFGVEGTIIGIIKDFHSTSLHEEIVPFALLLTERANFMFIRIKPHDISNTLMYIENNIKQIVPDDPFEYQFLEDQIDNLYLTEALTGKLAMIITLLAIFISCLGLFGLVLSSVEHRTKEIGIRKSIGAETREIMLMLTRDFTFYVVISFIIACPIAFYAMNKWLQNFAYKTTIKWWVFLLAGLITYVIAILTVSWQSWKAASRNPVEALRYE
ncbi:MAG: ABC transporter permease [Bacteroidales bacterium]|nr:ABC transporter permease [Bacteroidales bacterium]